MVVLPPSLMVFLKKSLPFFVVSNLTSSVENTCMLPVDLGTGDVFKTCNMFGHCDIIKLVIPSTHNY